jgi:hypothetical protein
MYSTGLDPTRGQQPIRRSGSRHSGAASCSPSGLEGLEEAGSSATRSTRGARGRQGQLIGYGGLDEGSLVWQGDGGGERMSMADDIHDDDGAAVAGEGMGGGGAPAA